jgi:hypothetical protein
MAPPSIPRTSRPQPATPSTRAGVKKSRAPEPARVAPREEPKLEWPSIFGPAPKLPLLSPRQLDASAHFLISGEMSDPLQWVASSPQLRGAARVAGLSRGAQYAYASSIQDRLLTDVGHFVPGGIPDYEGLDHLTGFALDISNDLLLSHLRLSRAPRPPPPEAVERLTPQELLRASQLCRDHGDYGRGVYYEQAAHRLLGES